MKHIRLCKVYGLRWSDGEVHCERCGGKGGCGSP